MHGGKFRGRQPESLSEQEWAEIAGFLMRNEVPSEAVDAAVPPGKTELDEWSFL
jgi:hypothetical protein